MNRFKTSLTPMKLVYQTQTKLKAKLLIDKDLKSNINKKHTTMHYKTCRFQFMMKKTTVYKSKR